MMTSLVSDWMCLNDVVEFGDVQKHATSGARSPEKTSQPEGHASLLPIQLLGHGAKGYCLDVQLDLAVLLCLGHLGFVLKHEVEGGLASGDVTHQAHEHRHPTARHLRHRQLDREQIPVLVLPTQFTANADDARGAIVLIVAQIAVV